MRLCKDFSRGHAYKVSERIIYQVFHFSQVLLKFELTQDAVMNFFFFFFFFFVSTSAFSSLILVRKTSHFHLIVASWCETLQQAKQRVDYN